MQMLARRRGEWKMKFRVWMTLPLMSVFLVGCATSGNYCEIARAIRPSVEDQLTPETKRQILVENEKVAKLCGIKP